MRQMKLNKPIQLTKNFEIYLKDAKEDGTLAIKLAVTDYINLNKN